MFVDTLTTHPFVIFDPNVFSRVEVRALCRPVLLHQLEQTMSSQISLRAQGLCHAATGLKLVTVNCNAATYMDILSNCVLPTSGEVWTKMRTNI